MRAGRVGAGGDEGGQDGGRALACECDGKRLDQDAAQGVWTDARTLVIVGGIRWYGMEMGTGRAGCQDDKVRAVFGESVTG